MPPRSVDVPALVTDGDRCVPDPDAKREGTGLDEGVGHRGDLRHPGAQHELSEVDAVAEQVTDHTGTGLGAGVAPRERPVR